MREQEGASTRANGRTSPFDIVAFNKAAARRLTRSVARRTQVAGPVQLSCSWFWRPRRCRRREYGVRYCSGSHIPAPGQCYHIVKAQTIMAAAAQVRRLPKAALQYFWITTAMLQSGALQQMFDVRTRASAYSCSNARAFTGVRLPQTAIGVVSALNTIRASAADCEARRACDVIMSYENADEESGKFRRHSELSPGCSPLGVLCAGLDENQLEAVAEALENVWQGADGTQISHVPIVALSQGDMRPWVKLRSVLAQLQERDSELPARGAAVHVPLVLFSGFNTVQTSAAVRAISVLGLKGGSSQSRPMYAVAVPRALDKSLRVLCDELEGDHNANRQNVPQ
eukprot:6178594-Pleurochrysis_carterae.AAC.2